MNQLTFASDGAPPFVDPQTLSDDAHATLATLRSRHRVIQLGDRHYMVLRADDVLALLTDARTKQIDGPELVQLNRVPNGAAARLVADFFLFSNGDAHRARRGLFARAFAHRAMRDSRERIRAVADGIVAELPRGESFDFVERMAARVPAEMIAAILGLPAAEVPYFTRLVSQVARAVTPIYPHDDHEHIEAATVEFFAYVAGHLGARMRAPKEDLLSTLTADWQAEQVLSFDTLVHQVIGIIVGGSDTTRAGFAMLVALLLQNRRAWEAVKADEALIPRAVAEGMRYDPPVGSIPRVTVAPVEIGDVTFPQGMVLRLSTMSALRDPALYPDPDSFDICRDHPRLHPAFGGGPHRCIGEMLARLEMEEALSSVISAAPGIELETPPRMVGFGGIRQITPMPVRIPLN